MKTRKRKSFFSRLLDPHIVAPETRLPFSFYLPYVIKEPISFQIECTVSSSTDQTFNKTKKKSFLSLPVQVVRHLQSINVETKDFARSGNEKEKIRRFFFNETRQLFLVLVSPVFLMIKVHRIQCSILFLLIRCLFFVFWRLHSLF